MSPSGLPGFFVVIFVVFAFAYLFVSQDVAKILFWLMIAVVIVVSGFAAYRWSLARRG